MSVLLGAAAAGLTACAAVVLLAGVAAALRHGTGGGAALAAHAGLALELLLAAGLVRLPVADSYRMLALVAALVALRQVIGRGIRAGAAP